MQQSSSTGRGAANYHEMERMLMHYNTNHASAKAFDESNIEPSHPKNFGKDMMSMSSQSTTGKGNKKQRRATDGKFESIKSLGMYDGGKAEGRANERKGGGRKAGGVEAAFYNHANTPMEEDKTPDDRWPMESESAVVIPSFTPEGDAF